MDERLKDIMENLEAMKIGLDEPFRFHCTMCGKCCIHREDILLSPKDIYNIAKELKLSTEGLFKQYCEVYVGQDSRMPIVRLKPKGSVSRCPLLKDRKCQVHRAKPTVCAMFPVGRCLVAANPEEGLKDITKDRIQYIFTNPGCGDGSETHTAREYLESFGIPVEDEFFLLWQQTVLEMGDIFRKIEKAVSRETMEQAWTAAFVCVYLHYKTELPFLPQFNGNVREFFGAMHLAFPDGGGKTGA